MRQTGVEKEKIVRPLSGVEILMSCMHVEMRGTAQATQVLHIEGALNIESLIQAANDLYNEFPILSGCIKQSEGQVYFYNGVDFLNIPVRFEAISNPQAEADLLSSIVDTPLPQEKFLWKLTILAKNGEEKYKVAMTFHHAILDGHGLSVIGTRFLYYLDNRTNKEIIAVKPRKFPQAINDFLSEKKTAPLVNSRKSLAHCVNASIGSRRTKWKALQLDSHLRECLERQANEDRLKPNAIFSAILAKSLVDTRLYENPVELKNAVSLRIFEGTQSQEISNLGCYMSVSNTLLDTSNRGIAEIAKSYELILLKDTLKRSLAKTQYSYKDTTALFQLNLESDTFNGGVGITNIGEISIPIHYRSFTLSDYFTTVNRTGGNYSVVVHCYSFNGRLTVQFVYPTPIMSDQKISNLVSAFKTNLNLYLNGTN